MPKMKYVFEEEKPDRSCSGKNRYASQALAEARAEHRTHEDGRKIRAYWCGVCKGWHLTKNEGTALGMRV